MRSEMIGRLLHDHVRADKRLDQLSADLYIPVASVMADAIESEIKAERERIATELAARMKRQYESRVRSRVLDFVKELRGEK